MVKIHRIWFNTERMDREDHYKITLFSRPRVSIHVDEYIWSFIEENIVKPHKLKPRLLYCSNPRFFPRLLLHQR